MTITAVMRPAAVLPASAAQLVLIGLAGDDVRVEGVWDATPTLWRRYQRPWGGEDEPPDSVLIGTLQVAYGTPTRYDITIYRVTVSDQGAELGWTVESLCNEPLSYAELNLESCPRAELNPLPPVFRQP